LTNFMLGKQPPDPRKLMLHRYMDMKTLPPADPAADWSDAVQVPWGMFKNDSIGDCTCAAIAHSLMVWTANASNVVVPSDADVLATYSAITGYDPSDPSTDRGAVEVDCLKYWRATGIAGHKIDAWADVDPTNFEHVKWALSMFGNGYIGLGLPLTAQNQVGTLWTVDNSGGPNGQPGSWGGHAVNIVAYDPDGLTCVTWGAKQKMTWDFFKAYCDEYHAPLSKDWMAGNTSPAALDWATLEADLTAVMS
jgi:hypothetical protein